MTAPGEHPLTAAELRRNVRRVDAICHPATAALLLVDAIAEGTLESERAEDADAFDEAVGEARGWLKGFTEALASDAPAAPAEVSEGLRLAIRDAVYDTLLYFGAHDLHTKAEYLKAATKVADDIQRGDA